ncbi:hypothetical protein PIB30_078192 [Stylosanthes scabra]|uniref:Uncharacterized protein n=1 Tax=Stylosanthes scabra TaxID=79078 RepID=A0ABU6SQW5_9FABA|nr:hypothetical protein [Stylosanthes scabra]
MATLPKVAQCEGAKNNKKKFSGPAKNKTLKTIFFFVTLASNETLSFISFAIETLGFERNHQPPPPWPFHRPTPAPTTVSQSCAPWPFHSPATTTLIRERATHTNSIVTVLLPMSSSSQERRGSKVPAKSLVLVFNSSRLSCVVTCSLPFRLSSV